MAATSDALTRIWKCVGTTFNWMIRKCHHQCENILLSQIWVLVKNMSLSGQAIPYLQYALFYWNHHCKRRHGYPWIQTAFDYECFQVVINNLDKNFVYSHEAPNWEHCIFWKSLIQKPQAVQILWHSRLWSFCSDARYFSLNVSFSFLSDDNVLINFCRLCRTAL